MSLPCASGFACAFAFVVTVACGCEERASAPLDRGPAEPSVEYVTEQEILMPLPLRVRLPARYGAERVLVFVHRWGMRDWDTIELSRAGQTWEGAVTCRAVSTVTGDTRYFFLALDGDGRPVVGSGSPEWPHVATIVRELPDGPQALAGQRTPLRCSDPADCPPDFVGCPGYAMLRPRCHHDEDCPNSVRCAWDGYCDAPPEPADDGDSEDERLAAAVKKATRRYQIAGLAGSRQH
jgi:hypothetical protein